MFVNESLFKWERYPSISSSMTHFTYIRGLLVYLYASIQCVGPLLTPNPSATTHNSTQILLEWFPPYLWPGQHISYFNISVINTSDSTATYYRVNSSYSEAIVSLELSLASLEDTCSELVFEISAVVDGLKILRSYTITEKYIPSRYPNF